MDAESAVSVESPIPLFATVPGSAPSVSDSHATWMERAPHRRLMLFSGRSNPELGGVIAAGEAESSRRAIAHAMGVRVVGR